MKLWHCQDTRSLRVLWALEELQLPYELEVMAFPPRYLHKGYMDLNILGTVPYFTDGKASMTESSGICLYLVEKHQRYDFGLKADHPEFADYLNWLFSAEATLSYPQAIVLRYTKFEPEERRLPQAAADHRRLYLARLRKLDRHIENREFLCDDRFTIADITVGYALFMGTTYGIDQEYSPQVQSYLARLMNRPAFIRARELD